MSIMRHRYLEFEAFTNIRLRLRSICRFRAFTFSPSMTLSIPSCASRVGKDFESFEFHKRTLLSHHWKSP